VFCHQISFDLQTIIFVVFGLASVGQLFMLAYFGNAIESTSDGISNAIYESDWIERDRDHRKIMMITMESVRNPMVIKTIKLFHVNLPTFLFVYFFKLSIILIEKRNFFFYRLSRLRIRCSI
jgi:hypothetical protein